jgi:hypothetical protein
MRSLLAGRGWWIALAVLVVAIVFGSLRGGEEGRAPARESLDQGSDGFAAWAQLLDDAGGQIEDLGRPPSSGGLDPESTVVALDIGDPTGDDVEALREFVAGGGYLIAGGGTDPEALREIAGLEPRLSAPGAGPQLPLVPVAQTEGVATVDPAGGAAWADPGPGLPVLGSSSGNLLLLGGSGDPADPAAGGQVALLASSDALTNEDITLADNAQFALDLGLAGGPERPIVFLQSLALPGDRQEGVGALPDGWTGGFAGLLLAALVLIASRVRRLGPPDGDPAPAARPRADYIDAMARVLARTGDLAKAAEPVRRAALDGIARRSGGPATDDADMLAARARQAGVQEDEAAALAGPLKEPEAAIKAASALARVRRDA